MKQFLVPVVAIITVSAAFAALQNIGLAQEWKFDALHVYSWLPLTTIIGLGYSALYILNKKQRQIIAKVIEIVLFIHIFLFIFELWQNSASFPPITTRQYIVEIFKLSLIFTGIFIVVLYIRNAFAKLNAHVYREKS